MNGSSDYLLKRYQFALLRLHEPMGDGDSADSDVRTPKSYLPLIPRIPRFVWTCQ